MVGLIHNIKNGLEFQIKYTMYSLKRWPFIIILYLFFICGLGILEPIEVYLQKGIVSAMTNDLMSTNIDILITISIYFIVSALFIFQAYASPIVQRIVGLKVASWIEGKIHFNLQCCPMELLDNADAQIKIDRAKESIIYISSGPAILMYNIAYFISLLISTIQLIKYPTVLIIYYIMGLMLAINRIIQANHMEEFLEKTEIERKKINYFKLLQQSKDMIIENRIHSYNRVLKQKWNILGDELFKRQIKLKKIQELNFILLNLAYNLIGVVPFILLFKMLNTNNIDLATYTMIMGMGSIIIRYIGYIANTFSKSSSCGIYTKDIEEILNIENLDKNILNQKNEYLSKKPIIKFENVCFHYYPEKKVLKNINFELNKNEVIALVGGNGSGKSTLSALALGLYRAKSGSIKIKGMDINSINKDDIRILSKPVFQDFVQYEFTLRENIGYGDLSKIDDDKALDNAGRVSGLDQVIEEKELTYNSFLGKLYETEGKELSGGEWQKVAISRAFIGNSEMIIFDEPTSAIDPLSEIELFNYIKKNFENKSSIIISHRVGICQMADRIIFLKDGEIAEIGTHKDLYAEKKLYYNFFNEQAKWYDWSV
ncbi:ATP-binding cassette domain-containing protein [Clostridium sp.]|uniref:ATP-binding cassette domain-containing protein n=1 Tax=Clostridium sp. TaxID=1506 RepID=UPI003F35557B